LENCSAGQARGSWLFQRSRTPERKVEEAFGFAGTAGPAAKTTSLRLVKFQTTLGRAGAESGLGRFSPVRAWGSVGFRLGGAVPACQSQDVTVSAWPDGLRPAQACGRLLEIAGDRDGFRLDQNRLTLGRLVLHGRMSLWLGVGYQAVQDPVQHASQRPGHSPGRRKARRALGDRRGRLGLRNPVSPAQDSLSTA